MGLWPIFKPGCKSQLEVLELKKLLTLAVVMLLGASLSASAGTFIPSIADLAGFSDQAGAVNTAGGVATAMPAGDVTNDLPSFVKFVNNFTGANGSTYGYFGKSGAIDTSLFSTLSLYVANTNENTWNFGLWAIDSGGNLLTSTPTVPLPAQGIDPPDPGVIFSALSLDLTGAVGSIVGYGVFVGGNLPLGGTDRTAEFFATVPEPGFYAALALGLFGVFLHTWRRRQQENI